MRSDQCDNSVRSNTVWLVVVRLERTPTPVLHLYGVCVISPDSSSVQDLLHTLTYNRSLWAAGEFMVKIKSAFTINTFAEEQGRKKTSKRLVETLLCSAYDNINRETCLETDKWWTESTLNGDKSVHD